MFSPSVAMAKLRLIAFEDDLETICGLEAATQHPAI